MNNGNLKPSVKNRKAIRINALSNANLIKLLMGGTYSCAELAAETGLHYCTVLEYTRALHHVGAAFIDSWEKDPRGRDATKIYKLGTGKDTKRERMSGSARTAKYREKKCAQQMALVLGGQGRFVNSGNGQTRFERGELCGS